MAVSLTALRILLRVLPAPLRECLAVRLFLMQRRHPEPEREVHLRSRGTEVTVAGLHATRFGEGPAVLLIHGWEGRGLQLGAYVDPLVAAGHSVLALDGPNHGRNIGGIGALPTFADFLTRAIEETEAVAVVAHSLGSAAAIVASNRTGFNGTVLCLGGPAETEPIFERARAFMGLPSSGMPRFRRLLARHFDTTYDDVLNIEAVARQTPARLAAILAAGDEDVPVEESRRIIEAGGGTCTVLDVTHRSVMWDPVAVEAGLAALRPTLLQT